MTRSAMTRTEVDSGLLTPFVGTLLTLPGFVAGTVQTAAEAGGLDVDARIEATIQGRPVHILVEFKGSGYPRDLALVAHKMNRLRDGAKSVAAVVAAPAISPGGREFLRQEHIGYWDSGGSLYLELPWALYFIDRPLPQAAERNLHNPYSGRSAQVLHTLLMNASTEWASKDLAESANVSAYTAHLVLKFLEDQLWVERCGRTSWKLREPGRLLDAWAEVHTLRQYEHRRFYVRQPSWPALRQSVTASLEANALDYALTLGAGSELVAPYATSVTRLHVIVPPKAPVDDLAERMGLRPVEEGENVVFLIPRSQSPLMFRQRVDSLWVASDVQLYLDLFAWPLRGKEQAKHLRTERLAF